MQKPPLPYWLTAAVIDFFGTGFSTGTQLFIARIPAILGSAMTVAATYLIGRRLGGDKCGLFAGLLLAVAPPFKIEGMLLKADIIYTAAVTWSCFFLFAPIAGSTRAIESFRSKHSLWPWSPEQRTFCLAATSRIFIGGNIQE